MMAAAHHNPAYLIYFFQNEQEALDVLGNTLELSNYNYLVSYFMGYINEIPDKNNKNIIVLVENEYVDKFYLRDYSKYYAEEFLHNDRFTKRIHFFLSDLNKNDFEKKLKNILENGNEDEFKTLQKNYLGFIVRKPLKNENGYYLIGRTCLKTYPEQSPDGSERKFIKYKNKCSLFGLDLSVDSLPFHQQDLAVGACASASLWITQFAISNWFDIPINSLAEITEKSKLYYSAPIYPSDGLNVDEICKYLSEIGVHYHIINIKSYSSSLRRIHKKELVDIYINKFMKDAIRAYLSGGIPIICGLHMIKHNKQGEIIKEGLHAVVITGIKEKDGKLLYLYCHDDQIGPYCRTFLAFPNDFSHCGRCLANEWRDKYDLISIDTLIVPVDPLIRLSFNRIYQYYGRNIVEIARNYGYRGAQLFLTNVNTYKRKLVFNENNAIYNNATYYYGENNQQLDKTTFLTKNFSKYLWVIRFIREDNTIGRDILLDATRTLWHKLGEIEYP